MPQLTIQITQATQLGDDIHFTYVIMDGESQYVRDLVVG
jgi:hypothetical protein